MSENIGSGQSSDGKEKKKPEHISEVAKRVTQDIEEKATKQGKPPIMVTRNGNISVQKNKLPGREQTEADRDHPYKPSDN